MCGGGGITVKTVFVPHISQVPWFLFTKENFWFILGKNFFLLYFNMGRTVCVVSCSNQKTHPSGKCYVLFSLPGKHVVRCSISASWVTGFLAEFIAEMAKQRISPSGINWDWLMGDILIGDTSPAERQFSSEWFIRRPSHLSNTPSHMHAPPVTFIQPLYYKHNQLWTQVGDSHRQSTQVKRPPHIVGAPPAVTNTTFL